MANSIKQMLLLTDGCSNRGESPVLAAKEVKRKGITVNVIGIANREPLHRAAAYEIENIATAGGGLSRIVTTRDLTQTVQQITRRSVSLLIRHEVESVLQKHMGKTGSLTELSPETRRSVVQWMEGAEASRATQLLVLIDTSASMRTKLPAVRQSLADLYVHLCSHPARCFLSLYTFPTTDVARPISRMLSWTSDANRLRHWRRRVKVNGITPTGPALLAAANEFQHLKEIEHDAL